MKDELENMSSMYSDFMGTLGLVHMTTCIIACAILAVAHMGVPLQDGRIDRLQHWAMKALPRRSLVSFDCGLLSSHGMW